MQKILFVIFDGLGDRPIKKFNGQTPLEAAHTPTLDKLAGDGICGVMNAMPTSLYPTSEEAHLAIFGYDFVKDYPGRGVLQALGIGIKLKPDEMAFRIDFGTVDEHLKLTDPRAGVISSVKDLAKACNNIEVDGITFKIYPSLLYRGVLVLSGMPVKNYLRKVKNAAISDTDPHKSGPHKIGVRVLHPKPFGNTKEGKTVARALERYQYLTHEILNEHKINKKRVKRGLPPANFILARGEGRLKPVQSFKDKYGLRAACVAGAPLYKGIAGYLGMKVLNVRGATGTLNTNVGAKVKASIKALKKNDFVFLHFKGTDMAAEELGDPELKKKFIEKADKAMKQLLDLKNVMIVVTGDHSTPCELKDHSTDPVPILINNQFLISNSQSISNGQNTKFKFGESECGKGSLGHIYGKDVMRIILSQNANLKIQNESLKLKIGH